MSTRPVACRSGIGITMLVATAVAAVASVATPVRHAAAQAGTLGDTAPRGPTNAPAGIARLARADTGRPAVDRSAMCASMSGCARTHRNGSRHDWWAPVASGIIPGAGQARLGQDRFVGYMAVEGFLWVRYLTDRRAGTDARNAYRDLAIRVSRAAYPGPKPQGNFEYYERMEHWIASGAYDADPTVGFAPETDSTTFNGKMWSIARTTFWSDPRTPPPVGSAAYEAAIQFYMRNAVRPEFQWSWRDSPLHQDVYRRSVRASNDGFRHAAQDMGAVIANHVLSTVDAYISLRLRLHQSTDNEPSTVGFGATLPFETIDRMMHRASRSDSAR
jgi:hypothetical protein